MNLMNFMVSLSTKSHSAPKTKGAEEALESYAKLVEATKARKKTWAEIAEELKKIPPIKLPQTSAEIIREIRDEL
jgi:predicted patatin/cPLA2 family phospholipase